MNKVLNMATSTKPKRFACRYCKRLFARSEHRLRHERTHTKEKPYQCSTCSQGFARSDLLARHVRLTHEKADASQEAGQAIEAEPQHATAAESSPVSPSPLLNETEMTQSYPNAFIPTSHLPPEHGQDDILQLNAISMVAEQQNMQELDPDVDDDRQGSIENQPSLVSMDPLPDLGSGFLDGFEDYLNISLDGPLFSNHIVPSQMSAPQPIPVFESEHGIAASISGMAETSCHGLEPSSNTTTLMGHHTDSNLAQRRQPEPLMFSELTLDAFNALKENLKGHKHVIPDNFQLPTRLTLSRYLNAFISGFHEHMPFLHLPTMSVRTSSAHLVLAIAATGAFYRFEPEDGNNLFNVTEAIVMKRIRMDEASCSSHTNEVLGNQLGSLETQPEPVSTPQRTVDAPGRASSTPYHGSRNQEVEIMQTLILLMAIGTWAKNESMSRTAIRLQGVLASIIRQHGLDQSSSVQHFDWETWAEHESIKRTKLIAFCFMNLQSLLYDVPSPIRPSEIGLCLPSVGQMFAAKNAQAFTREREQASNTEHSFQTSLAQLFKEPATHNMLSHSSLGDYVLIHALLQNMFYARELSKSFPTESNPGQATYLPAMERALRNWQHGWQQNSDRSTDLNGPIAFNYIALLRIAYIRLNIANGPCRALESRNPTQIARAFLNYPRSSRSPQLLRAVTHSAYALSIPVKIGLRFVAQTQAVFWSIQHSLCSLECAVLLSSWLDSIAQQGIQLVNLEKKEQWVVKYVQSLLDETRFGICQRQEHPQSETKLLKRLSAGVVKVWAEVFRGPQTWAIVNVIGTSLELYGQLLEVG